MVPHRLDSAAAPARRAPRLWGWLLVALALLAVVWLLAPQQVPVTLYKLSLVCLAGVVGYWLDRSLFPYARPDVLMALTDAPPLQAVDDGSGMALGTLVDARWELPFAAAMLRRAVVVAAAMLAMGLGA